MSRIGRLEIELFAGTASFMKSIKEAELSVKVFGTKLRTGLGVEMKSLQGVVTGAVKGVLNLKTALAGAAAVYGAFKLASTLDAAADTVDKLGKASKRLGVTVEQLSALRFAAGESGIEFEALATMASKAGKAVAELVANGNATARIGRLNVELANSAGQVRNIAELIPDIARGIESAGSEAEQLRLAQKFFGKGGGDDFVTLLKESGTFVKGLADQTERARKLGVLFTDDQVEKLTAYRDAVGRVQEAWLGVKVKLMTEIAPALTRLLDDLAIRTANIPRALGAMGHAMTIASGGGEDARQAGVLLQTLGRSVSNLMIVTAREAATIFASTAVEGLRQVGTNIAIELGSGLRDILPDWMLNDTWFSPGDPQVGSQQKLQDLIRTREELARLNDEVATLQDDLDNNPYLDGQDRFRVEAQLNSALAALKRLSSTDFVVLDKQIQAAQRELELNTSQLAQQRSQAALESARRIKETFVGSESEIARALAAADKAMEDLTAKMATQDFIGPPAPPAETFPSVFRAFEAIAAQAQETGRQIGAGLAKGWETFKEAAKKNWEKTQDLLKEARQYRFELYPAEKVEADVAELRRVTAEVRKLGLQTALTEEEIEKLAGKWRDALKQPDKEVRNLATDMKKAIEGFATDAGQAFADFAFDAKGSLGEVLKSWGKTLFAMATQALIFKPLFDSLGGMFANSGLGRAAASVPTAATAHADGGSVSGASWSWVGERGPELVQFGRSGYVYPNGVMPGGGAVVQIIDQRGSGARPEVSQGRGPDGRQLIKVLIRDEVRGMISDGSLDRSMASTFGVGRRGTAR